MVHGLLIAVASPVVEHGLLSAWASLVVAHRLSCPVAVMRWRVLGQGEGGRGLTGSLSCLGAPFNLL